MFYLNFIVAFYLIFFQTILNGQSNDNSDSKTHGGQGLIFENESAIRLADSSYVDTIKLLELGENVHAIQFRLSFNEAPGDSTILFFEDIQKGPDLSDSNWLLDFNVINGQVMKNGASKNEVFVVLYNTNQDGGLSPGDYQHFITVKYRVAKVSGVSNDLYSTIKITHAEASTSEGIAVDIKPSIDEFRIVVKK